MQAHDALRALRAAGVSAVATGPRRLRAEDHELSIFTPRTAPTRADAVRALRALEPGQRALLIADKLTPSLTLAAVEDDRIVVVARDTVIWQREMLSLGDQASAVTKRAPGRRPYARFAVARALLASAGPLTQEQLMKDAGVSQGGISKALTSPLFDGVLTRAWGSIDVVDRGTLFDRAVTEYPGPGGVATYWWHETPVTQQAESVAAADETALLSGDVAADRIKAWRRPEHAVIYTSAEPDLRRLGFSLAAPDDYTLMLVYAEDRTLWSTARSWSTPQVADPVIAAYDVTRTGTLGDQGEAVDRLRDFVLGAR